MPRKAKGTTKPAGRRRTAATGAREATRGTNADVLRLCREGKHPPTRRIGRGCAVCGRLDAWGR